jgi:hypothetical protein
LRKLYWLVGVLFLLSCQKEIDWSVNNGNRRCVSCEYLPVCDSSLYRYIDSTNGRVDTLDNKMAILGDSMINGKRFYKVSGFATFNTGLFANCDGGDYRLLFPLTALGINVDSLVAGFTGGLPIPPSLLNIPRTVQTSLLKTAQPVNGTWIDTIYRVSIPFVFDLFAGLEYKVISKNVSHTVLQKTYNNVIQVNSQVKLVSPLVNTPVALSIDYFFARNIGLVEVQVRNGTMLTRSLKLFSYTL